MFDRARELGWTVDDSRLLHSGPVFIKGQMHIWSIRTSWQCTDLIDGRYTNQRPYLKLMNALELEGELMGFNLILICLIVGILVLRSEL